MTSKAISECTSSDKSANNRLPTWISYTINSEISSKKPALRQNALQEKPESPFYMSECPTPSVSRSPDITISPNLPPSFGFCFNAPRVQKPSITPRSEEDKGPVAIFSQKRIANAAVKLTKPPVFIESTINPGKRIPVFQEEFEGNKMVDAMLYWANKNGIDLEDGFILLKNHEDPSLTGDTNSSSIDEEDQSSADKKDDMPLMRLWGLLGECQQSIDEYERMYSEDRSFADDIFMKYKV